MLACSASGRKAVAMIVVEPTAQNRAMEDMSRHPGSQKYLSSDIYYIN
jgi:hypothetical protein